MATTAIATGTNITTDNTIVVPNDCHIDSSDASSIQSILTTVQNSPTSTPSLRPSLSWKSFRSTISVSEKTSAQLGWAVAFMSVLFTIVTLSPAFRSQASSERALKLAEWTALKDYIEECREELDAGIESQACLRAIGASVPPPPYVKAGVLDKTTRSLLKPLRKFNATTEPIPIHDAQVHLPRIVQNLIFLGLVLTACVFFFLSFERSRSRLLRRSHTRPTPEEEQEESIIPISPEQKAEIVTGTQSYGVQSPEVSLRRRPVRTYPIYRHKTLGDAIQAEDLEEIRSRLQSGEDVNEHWHWLIYRLAIKPTPTDSSNGLEVARLCLDFGADVNALKGWNGQSALMIAIHFGNVQVAKLLIANGAMVSYSPPDSYLTALHRCVRLAVVGSSDDALEIIKALFAHGAKVNQLDRLGESALHKVLIEAWLNRQDQEIIMKLYPIALCLVEHGATMPLNVKQKYMRGNPLWDLVYTAIWETDWPEHIGPHDRLAGVAEKMKAAKWESEFGQRGVVEKAPTQKDTPFLSADFTSLKILSDPVAVFRHVP
ncbi:ankyrin repeat-containing domain protein [Dendryphion nanum]|uniref:Ankyrin repeat-containing domain protein n=1 Tax=Dendryphion nanum TaxID=256645 RepID=A0A9P9DQT6_9PLEO|nr:ankyrin repeat-containing domain protein [Dendryphion nanum]